MWCATSFTVASWLLTMRICSRKDQSLYQALCLQTPLPIMVLHCFLMGTLAGRLHLMNHLSSDQRVWADIEGHCVKNLLLGRTLIMRFCTGRRATDLSG